MGEERDPPLVGGTWEILRPLARGGMGVVYLARHRTRGESVALKVLYDKEHDFRGAGHERFVREANASEEIGHPGLVRTLDAGVEPDGTRYIVMELLEGQSLRERMRAGLSRRRSLEIVIDLLEPLAAAHAKGFVHRDLKPQNAFVVCDGAGRESVKLLDFGISRRPGVQTVTDFATAMGTPHYAAPEQMQNARDVTAAADVWSTGVLLYRLLTGRLPFEGDAIQMVLRAGEERHAPLQVRVSGIDARLSALVDRCLAKSPEDRPAHAGEVRAELAALLADPSLALPEEAAAVSGTQASVAQTMPTESTTRETAAGSLTDESTTPEAARADPPVTAADTSPMPAATDAAPSPVRLEAGPPVLPPPPPAPAPAPPVPPEPTPRPRQRRARARGLSGRAPQIAVGAALFVVGVLAVAIVTRAPPPRALRAVPLVLPMPAPRPSPTLPAAPPTRRVPAPRPSPTISAAPPTLLVPAPGDPTSASETERAALEAIVHGAPGASAGPVDTHAQRRARVLASCLPITDAVHGRCFLRALGGRAAGEFELRNLVAASVLTGDREGARDAANRYLAEHARSRYAAQVRQIAASVGATGVEGAAKLDPTPPPDPK